LRSFIHEYEISVLLCGHAHKAHFQLDSIDLNGKKWSYLEARCGTSAVTEEFPSTWLPFVRQPKPFERNTLLVHRVVDRADGVYWVTNAFRRSPLAQQRFVDAGHPAAYLPHGNQSHLEWLPPERTLRRSRLPSRKEIDPILNRLN
jgi:hypothetical protein